MKAMNVRGGREREGVHEEADDHHEAEEGAPSHACTVRGLGEVGAQERGGGGERGECGKLLMLQQRPRERAALRTLVLQQVEGTLSLSFSLFFSLSSSLTDKKTSVGDDGWPSSVLSHMERGDV